MDGIHIRALESIDYEDIPVKAVGRSNFKGKEREHETTNFHTHLHHALTLFRTNHYL